MSQKYMYTNPNIKSPLYLFFLFLLDKSNLKANYIKEKKNASIHIFSLDNGSFIYIAHFSICKFNVLNTEYKNRKTCVGFKMP